ncbi:MAG: TIGR01212 family radical SAM protein [Bacillota bacterium]|jgi:radical SAM protein (TIGR01212 family)
MSRTPRYNVYSTHLKNKFGAKVYKLPINLPGTCPNRDGALGRGGCIFCDEQGAGFECLPNSMAVGKQVLENKEFFRRRFKAEKFITYFQAFTNTYLPFEEFKGYILEACPDEDFVGLSISTRPDCINDRYLDFLREAQQGRGLHINIELGLQTVNYHTLAAINRGHSLAEFLDAVRRIRSREFDVCVHLILNLPGDNRLDAVENAKIISAMDVQYVKLHSLYIVAGTRLGEMYQRGEFEVTPLEEYIRRVVDFLEHLDPEIVIQRLVGKGPKENLLSCNWGLSWWKVKQLIEARLEEAGTYQGRLFNYLNGSALRRGLKD